MFSSVTNLTVFVLWYGTCPILQEEGCKGTILFSSSLYLLCYNLFYFIMIVTSPFHQSHLNWIHDPDPTQSRRLESKNTVPRNKATVNPSDPIPRNLLDPIPSASWNNSSVPHPSNSVRSNLRCVPRNNSENEVSAIATRGSPPAPLSSVPPKKRRTRRRLARRAANRKEESSSAAPLTQDARWANQRTAVPAGATQQLPETSDPTSAKRTAVYPPSRIVGGSPTNENSPFQIGLESGRIPGQYKTAVPDHQQGYSS